MLTDFQILSLPESAKNLQQSCCNISYYTLNVFLHYTLQHLNVHILSFLTTAVTKHLASKRELFLTWTNKDSVGYPGNFSFCLLWQTTI